MTTVVRAFVLWALTPTLALGAPMAEVQTRMKCAKADIVKVFVRDGKRTISHGEQGSFPLSGKSTWTCGSGGRQSSLCTGDAVKVQVDRTADRANFDVVCYVPVEDDDAPSQPAPKPKKPATGDAE